MAKEAIVLQKSSNGTEQTFSVAMWYPITSGAAPVTSNSAWPGASAAGNTAIQNGSVIEELRSYSFPVNTPAAAIKAVLQQAWKERNAQIGGVRPDVYEGVYLDPVAITTNGGWSA